MIVQIATFLPYRNMIDRPNMNMWLSRKWTAWVCFRASRGQSRLFRELDQRLCFLFRNAGSPCLFRKLNDGLLIRCKPLIVLLGVRVPPMFDSRPQVAREFPRRWLLPPPNNDASSDPRGSCGS